MRTGDIDWVMIQSNTSDSYIGAVGFLSDESGEEKAAVIVSFYDDYDGNEDGKLSIGEKVMRLASPISMKGRAATAVAMQARFNEEVLSRDPNFGTLAAKALTNFATSMAIDGIYLSYLKFPVASAAKAIVGNITQQVIKGFIVRKGMEAAVKKAFKELFTPEHAH
jgi:hypothetical protein